jgi:hypothetical protein
MKGPTELWFMMIVTFGSNGGEDQKFIRTS